MSEANCGVCEDRGIVVVNWADAPHDYAVCLCPMGLNYRTKKFFKRETHALWEVWAAREQVDPARIVMIEDVLTDDELAERGALRLPAETAASIRESALLSVGRRKKEPKL